MKCVGGRVEFMMRRRSQTGRNGWEKGGSWVLDGETDGGRERKKQQQHNCSIQQTPPKKSRPPSPSTPRRKNPRKMWLDLPAFAWVYFWVSFIERERKGRGTTLLFISTFLTLWKLVNSDRLVCEYFRLKKVSLFYVRPLPSISPFFCHWEKVEILSTIFFQGPRKGRV